MKLLAANIIACLLGVSYGYVRVTEQVLFTDADAKCMSTFGTNAASIHSYDDFVLSVAACDISSGACWLGGEMTDIPNKIWTWEDGTAWDYSYWGEWNGVPQGEGITGEYYTCIFNNLTHKVQDCGAVELYYPVCNQAPTSEPTTPFPTGYNPYQLITEGSLFVDANAECQAAFGTDLASIHSYNDFKNAVQACDISSGLCWLGGNMTDRANKVWTWIDGTEWDYANWGEFNGVPQGQGITGEFFTCIFNDLDLGLQDCGDVETYYPLCEAAMTPAPTPEDAAEKLNKCHALLCSTLISFFCFFCF